MNEEYDLARADVQYMRTALQVPGRRRCTGWGTRVIFKSCVCHHDKNSFSRDTKNQEIHAQ